MERCEWPSTRTRGMEGFVSSKARLLASRRDDLPLAGAVI